MRIVFFGMFVVLFVYCSRVVLFSVGFGMCWESCWWLMSFF